MSKYAAKYRGKFCPATGNTAVIYLRYQQPFWFVCFHFHIVTKTPHRWLRQVSPLTTRLPIDEFSLKIMYEYFSKLYWEMILGNCPTWRTNSFQCIYLFIVPYMFRACHAHHQEKQILSIQLLVIVTPCWWHCHQHGVTITRSCIDKICFSWWWAWHARNM